METDIVTTGAICLTIHSFEWGFQLEIINTYYLLALLKP